MNELKTFVLIGEAPELEAAIIAAGYQRASTANAPLDLAINISTPSIDDVCPIEQQSEEDFDRITADLLGKTFRNLQDQLPRIARAGGTIVNIVSMLALEGREGCAPIAACEHAIIGLTQCAAKTFAGRAAINVVCVSRHFAGNEAELARVVLGLASSGMRGISGQTIVLDGGKGAAY